jgi:hypothetical protein
MVNGTTGRGGEMAKKLWPGPALEPAYLELVFDLAHSVDRLERLLSHLLLIIGANHAPEHNATASGFAAEAAMRDVRVPSKHVRHTIRKRCSIRHCYKSSISKAIGRNACQPNV